LNMRLRDVHVKNYNLKSYAAATGRLEIVKSLEDNASVDTSPSWPNYNSG
jgi:hypothetical protein